MSLESFHRMMDLPLEIRHQIYFWATPDRVVQFRYLNCSTPIPALLHTCSESRDYLLRTGYKLAFRAKLTGRRFWFNFERDALFIDRAAFTLLEKGINPFPLEDTPRVQKIVYDRWTTRSWNRGFELTLQSFGELQEIFLIEWHRAGIDFSEPLAKSCGRYFPDPTPQRHSYDTKDLYKFAEIQKIDAYFASLDRQTEHWNPNSSFWCYFWSLDPPAASIPRDTDLDEYLSEPYEKWRSLDRNRKILELEMKKFWAKLGRPSEKLPKFNPRHLLTDAEHQFLQRERIIGCAMLRTTFRTRKVLESNKDHQVALSVGY